METSYTPRTPHVLALAMKDGEPALYKDGILTKIGAATAAGLGCSPGAAADAFEAAAQFAAYRSNMQTAGVINALSVLFPPLFGAGAYFQVRAADHEGRSNAHLVDAINKHNDAMECVP